MDDLLGYYFFSLSDIFLWVHLSGLVARKVPDFIEGLAWAPRIRKKKEKSSADIVTRISVWGNDDK